MLDFNEIRELEDRYERYLQKKNTQPKAIKLNQKQIIIILLSCLLLVLIVFLISKPSSNPKANMQQDTITKSKQVAKDEAINDKNNTLEGLKQKSEDAKNRYDDDKKQTELAEKIVKKIEEKNIVLNEVNTSENQQKQQKIDIQQGWLTLNKIDTSTNYSYTAAQNIPENSVIDYEVEQPQQQIIQETKSKPKFEIQVQNSKGDDQEKILKNNFSKTHSISYALELARLYLEQGKYKEALKWSLQANEINSDNEDSWVYFAKAKYKLNQKNDAIRVLKSYNKNKGSVTIDTLIRQIESDGL